MVKIRDGRPVLLRQVARVIEGPEVKRGDSSGFVRRGRRQLRRRPGRVVLTVNKQPGTDTRQLTERVTAALEELKASLPPDIRIAPELYQQKTVHRPGHRQRRSPRCATAASWWPSCCSSSC